MVILALQAGSLKSRENFAVCLRKQRKTDSLRAKRSLIDSPETSSKAHLASIDPIFSQSSSSIVSALIQNVD